MRVSWVSGVTEADPFWRSLCSKRDSLIWWHWIPAISFTTLKICCLSLTWGPSFWNDVLRWRSVSVVCLRVCQGCLWRSVFEVIKLKVTLPKFSLDFVGSPIFTKGECGDFTESNQSWFWTFSFKATWSVLKIKNKKSLKVYHCILQNFLTYPNIFMLNMGKSWTT